jgi:hypothetical protein
MLTVILNVFSCSSQAPCNKWAVQYFSGNVVSIVAPNPFQQKAIQWARTGDAFKAALAELRPDLIHETIDKRILVTFSVGWTFAHELLKFEKELNLLDAYLLLDGCHTPDLNNWVKYAKRAMEGKCIMIAAHSSIVPPFISSTKSNTTIMDQACALATTTNDIIIPEYVTERILPKPITINLGAAGTKGTGQYLPPVSKTWKEDPLIKADVYGKFIKLHYSGNDRPDHVYIAWYTSERLWKLMGNLMMEDTNPEIPKLKQIPTQETPPKQEQLMDSIGKIQDLAITTTTEETKAITKSTTIWDTILRFLMFFVNLFKRK